MSFYRQDRVEKAETATKTIIFSQFTKALDLVEHELTENGYRYMRLDGTMTLTQRTESVRVFSRDASVSQLIRSNGHQAHLPLVAQIPVQFCCWRPLFCHVA